MNDFCPKCDKEIELKPFTDKMECPHCGTIIHLDWDYVGEGISVWIIDK